jgi:major type 1 subunit fimbrin (pilin)
MENGMNIRIKRAMTAVGVATAMALPLSSQASDGTITFTGAVTASTCTVKVNGAGTGDGSVALPNVDTSALTNAAAKTNAAGTFFNIGLSSCTAATDILPGPTAPTHVRIYFEAGPNVDQATGGLINANGTSNVEVNLYNASNASVVGTQILPGTATNTTANPLISGLTTATNVMQYFYAGYSTAANGGQAATAGSVSTSVTYSLVYN